MVLYAGFPAVSNGMLAAKEVSAAHGAEGAAATSGLIRHETSN